MNCGAMTDPIWGRATLHSLMRQRARSHVAPWCPGCGAILFTPIIPWMPHIKTTCYQTMAWQCINMSEGQVQVWQWHLLPWYYFCYGRQVFLSTTMYQVSCLKSWISWDCPSFCYKSIPQNSNDFLQPTREMFHDQHVLLVVDLGFYHSASFELFCSPMNSP